MSWFKLKRPMDEYTNVDPGDIVNAKQALRDLGYYQPPIGNTIGAWVDNKLFDGIRNFQRDNRLKVDGVMKPGGPTEAALNKSLRATRKEDEPGVATLRCSHCGAWHGGVYSPNVCADCWGKGLR
jgi:hypothetical protein